MARMGHDGPDAALIYQHATLVGRGAVAEAIDVVRAETETDEDEPLKRQR